MYVIDLLCEVQTSEATCTYWHVTKNTATCHISVTCNYYYYYYYIQCHVVQIKLITAIIFIIWKPCVYWKHPLWYGHIETVLPLACSVHYTMLLQCPLNDLVNR